MQRKAAFLLTVMFTLAFAAVNDCRAQRKVAIVVAEEDSKIAFAVGDLKRALRGAQYDVVDQGADQRIVFEALAPGMGPQSFRIQREGTRGFRIFGGDHLGLMYGGLELAERIEMGGGLDAVRDTARKPYIAKRGIKFNIPLDARTPSYSDAGDAAQKNIPVMWEFDFWREYLDELARNRYNVLTFWNPHPFPSLVKVPEYPEVALQDVKRADIDWVAFNKQFNRSGTNMVNQTVLKNLVTVKSMTIEEKIVFWRKVMEHAHDRGIDIYFITWNVFVWGTNGKYGITTDQTNTKTIDYIRASVREIFRTYPLLAGIGVTAGENMKGRKDEFSKEKWLWKAYGRGIMDAKKREPERDILFIHRYWQTAFSEITDEFIPLKGSMDLSFKYARARLYSSVAPPFPKAVLKDLPSDLKIWWNLRNDDIFNFRWGDPEYVRQFIRNLPPENQTAGYYMGSDGYVWGREFTSTEPETPRQLENKKHWYNFMLWGRLGYDPGLDRAFLEKKLLTRFPEARGTSLYDTWSLASKIIPLVNRFHWRDWDLQWAVEGCMDLNKFHTVEDFIKNRTMPESGLLSISDYAKNRLSGESTEAISPTEVAATLQEYADRTLREVGAIRGRAKTISKELRLTLKDLEAMAHLGNYYASKIRGAAQLHFFDQSQNPENKTKAVQHLQEATVHWEKYAAAASELYRPQLLARTRVLDWKKTLDAVKKDVEIARDRGKQ